MRLLVAEDHVHLGQMLKDMLHAWGYDPIVVNDGLAALDILQGANAPRLALLDWIMPGLDGIQVCREVRKDIGRPYTYLVLVTGQGGKQEMLDGLEAGADDYLVKPIDAHELKARLNTAKRILTLQEQLLQIQQLLREQATRDGLTGVWNRVMILDILTREMTRSQRERHPLGVIMADIDHFKLVNDTHGHLIGDEVLRQVAQRLLAVLRPYDTVGRYGGEEFLIVLPGCDLETTMTLAERLRRSVAAEPVTWEGGCVHVTLSLGVDAWDREGGNLAALLGSADEALYHAKHAGRNRVRRQRNCVSVPEEMPD
ncbi:MAG TPA: diguanylate cyclase [Gemmataceae bacterium]|nr:diguanylate cyclase [Gemmataceae bacterium]